MIFDIELDDWVKNEIVRQRRSAKRVHARTLGGNPKMNMKDVAPWAKYIAQDENGDWWQFDRRPNAYIYGEREGFWDTFSGPAEAICRDTPPDDWTKELWEIVRE